MSNLIPVEGNNDLVRDPRTDQIINTNTNAYDRYINQRKKRKLEKEKSQVAKDVTPTAPALDGSSTVIE